MRAGRQTADDEPSRGRSYEPGLHLVEPTEDRGTWEEQALCHGMYEVFDLADVEGRAGKEARRMNKYRTKAARNVCFDCPVFQQCWDDAMMTLPNGVIRAGAVLHHPFSKKRQTALETSLRLRTIHMDKKDEDKKWTLI